MTIFRRKVLDLTLLIDVVISGFAHEQSANDER